MRLAQRWGWLEPGPYAHVSRMVAEIGRLLGGWLNFTALRRIFGFPRMDAALCAMPGGISEFQHAAGSRLAEEDGRAYEAFGAEP